MDKDHLSFQMGATLNPEYEQASSVSVIGVGSGLQFI
jgi:hypothetical protein